jgi:hypothetical protein
MELWEIVWDAIDWYCGFGRLSRMMIGLEEMRA